MSCSRSPSPSRLSDAWRAGPRPEGGAGGRHVPPRPLGRRRHGGELHVARPSSRRGQGRHHPVPLRARPGHDRDASRRPRSSTHSKRVVIDGGGLVTLSGGGERRILYQNTCDPEQTLDHRPLRRPGHAAAVVQHLTSPTGTPPARRTRRRRRRDLRRAAAGSRSWTRRSVDNRCDRTGPDLGGAAVRALSQHHGSRCTSSAAPSRGGRCSNGSALSSIGVSWSVLNSTFTDNRAIGNGPTRPVRAPRAAAPAGRSTPTATTSRCWSPAPRCAGNHAREGGGAIFFVSNDRTGDLRIRSSVLKKNPSDGFENSPGIFFLGDRQVVEDSIVR